jgi:hypothetical protein
VGNQRQTGNDGDAEPDAVTDIPGSKVSLKLKKPGRPNSGGKRHEDFEGTQAFLFCTLPYQILHQLKMLL